MTGYNEVRPRGSLSNHIPMERAFASGQACADAKRAGFSRKDRTRDWGGSGVLQGRKTLTQIGLKNWEGIKDEAHLITPLELALDGNGARCHMYITLGE